MTQNHVDVSLNSRETTPKTPKTSKLSIYFLPIFPKLPRQRHPPRGLVPAAVRECRLRPEDDPEAVRDPGHHRGHVQRGQVRLRRDVRGVQNRKRSVRTAAFQVIVICSNLASCSTGSTAPGGTGRKSAPTRSAPVWFHRLIAVGIGCPGCLIGWARKEMLFIDLFFSQIVPAILRSSRRPAYRLRCPAVATGTTNTCRTRTVSCSAWTATGTSFRPTFDPPRAVTSSYITRNFTMKNSVL